MALAKHPILISCIFIYVYNAHRFVTEYRLEGRAGGLEAEAGDKESRSRVVFIERGEKRGHEVGGGREDEDETK